MSGPETLLGNGKLTVASRISSLFNGGASIVGGSFLVWFGLQVLDRLDKLEVGFQETRIYVAGAQERIIAFRQADTDLRAGVERTQTDLTALDRRVLILENRR